MKMQNDNKKYQVFFVENLLFILQERGITKQKLSQMSGVSSSYLAQIIKLECSPSINILASLSEALKVPLPLMLCNREQKMAEYIKFFK